MEISEEELRARLVKNATQGALIANWCKHPAFAMYEGTIQNIIDDKKNTWLTGSDEDAKAARAEARGMMKALKVLQIMKNSGQVAKMGLKKIQDLDSPNN